MALSHQRLASEYPELAIALFKHTNSIGQPMMFDRMGRRWAIPIYKDKAHHIVAMKSVQCGLTEWLIIKIIRHTLEGLSILYVLPTQDVRNKFVANRVDPLFNDNAFYRQGAKKTDNLGLKKLFTGGVNFIGSQSPSLFREYPAQVMIIDEKDMCDSDNLLYGVDRLSAARSLGIEPYIYEVSNPTMIDEGISWSYNQSNKQQWHIKCTACNEWQTVDWFKNFVKQTSDNMYDLISETGVCQKCGKNINRLSDGEWIAEYPDRDISGYHISKLFTDQTTIPEMWETFKYALTSASRMQRFYNSDLGIPYAGEGDKITIEDLANCEANYLCPMSYNKSISYGGIDVGKVFHVHIVAPFNGRVKTLYAGEIKEIEQLVSTLRRFNVKVYVIDAMPETRLAKKLVAQYRGGYICWYSGDKTGVDVGKDARKRREISVGRTESIDEMVFAYQNGIWMLPKNWRTLCRGEFVNQLIAPTREYDTKSKSYKWNEGTKDDHLFHASNYAYKAITMSGFGKTAPEFKWIG